MKNLTSKNIISIKEDTGITLRSIIDLGGTTRQSMWFYMKGKRKITNVIVVKRLEWLLTLLLKLKKSFKKYNFPRLSERCAGIDYKQHYRTYIYTLLDKAITQGWDEKKVIEKIMSYCKKTYFPAQIKCINNRKIKFYHSSRDKMARQLIIFNAKNNNEIVNLEKIVERWKK